MNIFRFSLLSLLIAAPLCIADTGQPAADENIGVDISTPSDKVLRAEGWELQIWYRAKGSRSEGQHGVLFRNGKPVEGSTIGTEMDTALGKMKFYGNAPEVLWEPSGWHFADKDLIKPSSMCP